MQNRILHHKRFGADPDAGWASVQVHAVIKVNSPAKVEVVRKSNAHAILDRHCSFGVEDATVQLRPQPDAYNTGNPSGQRLDELF